MQKEVAAFVGKAVRRYDSEHLMSEFDNAKMDQVSAGDSPRKPLPQGYRQGIITAITVLLGFSLGFLKFWGMEAPGQWTFMSVFPAAMLTAAIVFQIVALYRALRLADDEEHEHQKTVLWFIVSAVMLLLGLISAAWELA